MNMKKIGPCRIVKNILANSYELEIPTGVGISPIFNEVDLYPYVAGDTRIFTRAEDPTKYLQWIAQILVTQPLEVEPVLNTRVSKSTRKKDYLEYLVKWKKRPTEDST